VNSIMNIHSYDVWVRLGCTVEEQSFIQQVRFDIEISFAGPVIAEQTDALIDAVDYVKLTGVINEVALRKNYALIEHLCFSVFDEIKVKLLRDKKGQFKVSCLKLRPPVKQLQGGVSWTCQSVL
jgi:dihydroneopterin aldolase